MAEFTIPLSTNGLSFSPLKVRSIVSSWILSPCRPADSFFPPHLGWNTVLERQKQREKFLRYRYCKKLEAKAPYLSDVDLLPPDAKLPGFGIGENCENMVRKNRRSVGEWLPGAKEQRSAERGAVLYERRKLARGRAELLKYEKQVGRVSSYMKKNENDDSW